MSYEPRGMRVGGACLAAALAAAAPTILLGPWAVLAFPIAVLVAGGHVLVFGLPTYLIMRERQRVDWPQALTAGFLIGALPISAWQLLMNALLGQLGFSLFLFLLAGGLGMIGGAVFRAVVGPPVERTDRAKTAAVFE